MPLINKTYNELITNEINLQFQTLFQFSLKQNTFYNSQAKKYLEWMIDSEINMLAATNLMLREI
jgi:hypothetical protein